MAARSGAKESVQMTECDALPYEMIPTGELEPYSKTTATKTTENEKMIPSLKRLTASSSSEDDEDISSVDVSSDTSSEDEEYQTAHEDNRRKDISNRTTNYSATKNKQSSVKKDKKSVVQNNITIGTLVGNLHIGPSFSAMASASSTTSHSSSRTTSTDRSERHIERCMSSDRMIEDSELDSIAEAIGTKWKDVGEILRLNPDHLDHLERQNSTTILNRNAGYRMLYLWTQKYDKRATVKRLALALCKAGEKDVIKKIRS